MRISTNVRLRGSIPVPDNTLYHSQTDPIDLTVNNDLVSGGITASHVGHPIAVDEVGRIAVLDVDTEIDLDLWGATLVFLEA
jgi:hypothetical protein